MKPVSYVFGFHDEDCLHASESLDRVKNYEEALTVARGIMRDNNKSEMYFAKSYSIEPRDVIPDSIAETVVDVINDYISYDLGMSAESCIDEEAECAAIEKLQCSLAAVIEDWLAASGLVPKDLYLDEITEIKKGSAPYA